MTSDQVTLVQTSFAQLAPIADQAATIFYDRLFEIAPEVKPLLKRDMAEQRHKLIAMLGAVVSGLGDLNSILPAASALARRHLGYGVEAGQYVSVGQALLWALERGLGPSWTKDIAAAWTAAYSVLSDFLTAEGPTGAPPQRNKL